MRFGIIVFPGSNCDHDCYHVLRDVFLQPAELVWHRETDLSRFDALILPGGFSYGDYLRTGAMAKYSPVMGSVGEFARAGGPILGICNGFQILLEAGLLPGAMLPNRSVKFICRNVSVRLESNLSPFTVGGEPGRVLTLPIAHADGNYYADASTLKEMRDHRQIILRYCSPDGTVSDAFNPNGSLDSVAGISNRRGNVFGMMPHPERCSDALIGNTDGRFFFKSILDHFVPLTR